jgi:hypothetical protein
MSMQPEALGGTRGVVNGTATLHLGSVDATGVVQLRTLFFSVTGGSNPVMFTIAGLNDAYFDKPFTDDEIDTPTIGQLSYQLPPNTTLGLSFPDNHFVAGGPQLTLTFTAEASQYAAATLTGNYI